jgi:hypothetical protein
LQAFHRSRFPDPFSRREVKCHQAGQTHLLQRREAMMLHFSLLLILFILCASLVSSFFGMIGCNIKPVGRKFLNTVRDKPSSQADKSTEFWQGEWVCVSSPSEISL